MEISNHMYGCSVGTGAAEGTANNCSANNKVELWKTNPEASLEDLTGEAWRGRRPQPVALRYEHAYQGDKRAPARNSVECWDVPVEIHANLACQVSAKFDQPGVGGFTRKFSTERTGLPN